MMLAVATDGTLKLRAPAKLNLFLHIIGRRIDSYHLLQSVFRAVNVFDELFLQIRVDGAITRASNATTIPFQHDLSVRAAKLIQHYSACPLGVEIALAKHIPLGAGMGGGSSDAAAVLVGLNQLWELNLSGATLAMLALRLGADVPYFLRAGDQWANGIGEELTPIQLAPAYYVVIHPGVHCPTPIMFAQPDLKRDCTPLTPSDFLSGASVENVFEPVALRLFPEINRAHAWLRNQAGKARLTGSGAAIFAEVATPEVAQQIKDACPLPWRAWCANSI
jgi:4-diphosphocytidyl-2-C-methyl-D-erythritol kinase